MALPSFLLSALTFLLATYFLSADLPGLCRRTARQLEPGMLRFLRQFRSAALAAFGGYLKAQLLLSTGVFLILLVGFALLRHPYSLLLAAGLAVLDFIPLVGAGTVMVPWAFLVLFTRNYSSAVGIMVLWSVVALFRRTMEPKIVGNRTGLPPILSLVGIYAGMKLGGVA
jgi:sporulation integral membrane protein YtvI